MSMAKEVSAEELLRRVERLEDEVSELRKSQLRTKPMTDEEDRHVKKGLQELREGKTVSHEQLKKELGL